MTNENAHHTDIDTLPLMSALEETMITDNASAFVQHECPASLVRAAEAGNWQPARATWPKLAELGWLELLVDDDSASIGLPAICLIAEQLGRAAYPLPFAELATMVLPLLSRHASAEQQRDLLPELISGARSAAIAVPASGLANERKDCPRWPLTDQATTLIANHLSQADVLLVPVDTTSGLALLLLPRPAAGWQGKPLPDMANSSWSIVSQTDLNSAGAILIGQGELTWDELAMAFERFRLATCASIVGLSAQALDLAIAYAKERIAFGKPLGTLQAVQHRLAEAAMEVAAARLLYQEASIEGNPGLIASACIQVAEAGKKATFTAQQVWGGMGFTLEVDVQLYFRRARALQLMLGHPWEAQEKVWTHLVPH